MIYVLGRGGTKLFAAIGVTYPASSTLTCTDGKKTLKAKTTTGQWVFAVPYAGTWIVTATDGTKSKSQTVKITSEGQLESVNLTQLWLYNKGNEYTDITGGWSGFATHSNTSKGTFTKRSASIYIKADGTSGAQSIGAAPEKIVDLTNVDTLHLNVTEFAVQTGARTYFSLTENRNAPIVAIASAEITKTGELTLDVSALAGSYYIVVWARAADGAKTYELAFDSVYGD